MARSQLPSIDVLRQLIRHDAKTGLMWWKERDVSHFVCGSAERCRHWNGRYAGAPALNMIIAYGYLGGTLFGQKVKAHRVIWALEHGEWPEENLDHINHDKQDNRIANLRQVSQAENMKNLGRQDRAGNKSPRMGVYFVPLERPGRRG